MVRSVAIVGLDNKFLQFKSKRSFASTGTPATVQHRSFAEAGDGRVWGKLKTRWGTLKDVMNSPDLSDAIGGANSVTAGTIGLKRVRKAWEILATPDLRALVAELNRRERLGTSQAENFQVQESEGSGKAKEMIDFLGKLEIDERSIAKILNAPNQSPTEGLKQMRALIQQKNAHEVMTKYLRKSLDQVQAELNLLFDAVEAGEGTGIRAISLAGMGGQILLGDAQISIPGYVFPAEEQLSYEVRKLANLYQKYDPKVLRAQLVNLYDTVSGDLRLALGKNRSRKQRQRALQTAKSGWDKFYEENYPKDKSSTVTVR